MTPLVGALGFSCKLAFYTILSIQEDMEYVRIVFHTWMTCLSYLHLQGSEISYIMDAAQYISNYFYRIPTKTGQCTQSKICRCGSETLTLTQKFSSVYHPSANVCELHGCDSISLVPVP